MTALDVDLKNDFYHAQSKFIKRLKSIAVKYNIVVLMVAHPRKHRRTLRMMMYPAPQILQTVLMW